MTTSTQIDLEASVKEKNAAPLWTVMSKMAPPYPIPKATPVIWRYDEMRPLLMEAGKQIGAEEAERRVLMLVNPTMVAPHTTDTIYGGLQLVLPGEIAPAHRHAAFALRFIIEGTQGGFTAVEGQKVPLLRGDVILTPKWHWHDHGNDGSDPIIWLDGLDIPLFQNVPVHFQEHYPEKRYPSSPAPQSPFRFPWEDVRKVLDKDQDSYSIYHYHAPGRKHISDTISAQAERIAAGHTTKLRQETCSFMYHVESGEGTTKLRGRDGKETEITWKARDTFAVPAWSQIQHVCTSSSDAYLFAVNDRPMIEALGLYREQSLPN